MTVEYDSPTSTLLPLSFADRISNLNTMTTHAGYTLPRAAGEEWDVARLEGAVRRAADKWRLMAGRVEKDEVSAVASGNVLFAWAAGGRGGDGGANPGPCLCPASQSHPDPAAYGVRVPLGELSPDHEVVAITRETYDGPFPSALGSLTHDPRRFALLDAPDLRHFVHTSTDLDLAKLVKTPAPILALHLGTFADTLTLGLSVPHGVFDAKGLGLVLNAIQAELNGDKWTPPPLDQENRVSKAVDELITSTTFSPYGSLKRKVNDSIAMLWFAVMLILRFKTWRKCASKGVFIGERVLAGVVGKTKAEVVAEGKGEYVSEGDVVSAWLMKAIFAEEAEKGLRRRVAWSGKRQLAITQHAHREWER